MHGVKGRFVPGYLPALEAGDGGRPLPAPGRGRLRPGPRRPLHRRGTLCRPRLPGRPRPARRHHARSQATPRFATPPRRPSPSTASASAALLVLAICELPAPQTDLLGPRRATVQLHPQAGPALRRAGRVGAGRRDDEEALSLPRPGAVRADAQPQAPPRRLEAGRRRARPCLTTAPGGRTTRAWPSSPTRRRPAARRTWRPRTRALPISSSR